MNDIFSLKGKRVLVTGGTRGIGAAISKHFGQCGATIIANYVRDEKAANELMESAQKDGWDLVLCRADLTGKKGLRRLVDVVEERVEKLSALIHCAATGIHRPVTELTTRHFDWTFSLNIRAFFQLVTMLLPWLEKGSSIIPISSQGAVQVLPSYALVGSTKGALESFSRHLAAELAVKGIRVNIISPGSILTDAWEAMPEKEKRIESTIKLTPLGRLVKAEEVAAAAQFLCSEAASGIVGHTLVVDGGRRIVG